MPVYFNNRQFIEQKIAELGGTGEGTNIPKVSTFANLPENAEAGTIAVVLDEDYIYVYDDTDAVWKATGFRGTGDETTNDGLTKAEADTYYADINHSHTEYAPVEHNHTEYAPLNHNHEEYAEIDDVTPAPTSVYSSSKVEELISNIPAGDGSGGTGDLTKAQADSYYAPLTHNHEEYLTEEDLSGKADVNHTHTEYAEINDTLPSSTSTYSSEKIESLQGTGVYETKISVVPDTEEINPEEYENDTKFIQNNELLYVDGNPVGEKNYPETPITNQAEWDASGWVWNQSNIYAQGGTEKWNLFNGNYIRSTGYHPAWFSYTFPEPLRIEQVFVGRETAGTIPREWKLEATADGTNWIEGTKQDNLGNTTVGIERVNLPKNFLAKAIRITITSNTSAYFPRFTSLGFYAPGSVIKQLKKLGNSGEEIETFGYKEVSLTEGEDAGVKIREALENATSIYIPEGVWNIDTMIRIPSNKNIKMHPQAILKRTSNIKSIFINDADGVTGKWDANENIHIEGGILDGNYTAFPAGVERETGLVVFVHSKNCSVKDTEFRNLDRWHMVEINSSFNVKLERCRFIDYINGGTFSSEAVQIDYSFEEGMPMVAPYDNTMCNDIIIRDCFFDNVKDGIGGHSALAGKLHRKITIERNNFKNGTGKAIKGLNWEDVTVQDNLIERYKDGIHITLNSANSGRIRIRNNKLFEIGFAGGVFDDVARGININSPNTTYRFTRVFIEDNILSLIGKHGIGFDYGKDVYIRGNSVQGVNQVGLWSYGGFGVVMENNTVRNTNIAGVLVASRADIMVGTGAGATATTDTGIVIKNNMADSLRVDQCDRVILDGNIVTTIKNGVNSNISDRGNIII